MFFWYSMLITQSWYPFKIPLFIKSNIALTVANCWSYEVPVTNMPQEEEREIPHMYSFTTNTKMYNPTLGTYFWIFLIEC